MNYSKDQFFRLMEAVEEQGGVHLDEQCKAQTYAFTGDKSKPVTYPSCGNSALFEIPYVNSLTDELQPIQVCAVEDDLGLWPRFREEVFGDDS